MKATMPSIQDIAETDEIISQPLAIEGGPQANPDGANQKELFHWPIVTAEDEEAILAVLRDGSMSDNKITKQFEAEYAAHLGVKFALGYANGTMALAAAMWAVGLRRGDELICPSLTYWASALQAFSLGATVVFADVDPDTLCLDPNDLERRVSPRTKAIMVVHNCGYPADMDAILRLARRRQLKVIEDVSHAHGGLYRGRQVGTFGDVAAMSMMSAKSFPIGEGGMLVTDNRSIYEHALAFSHYERTRDELTLDELKRMCAPAGIPLGLAVGGVKGRMNQTCAAMGRVQLKHHARRIAEIQRALNRFWDLLEDTPGIRPHRTPVHSNSTMGGWYNLVGHYVPEELGGLSVERFVQAVKAEGAPISRANTFPLHLHPLFNSADIYGDGKPTRIAFSESDIRQPPGSLPHVEATLSRTISIPWFRRDYPELIALHAAAFRKVALHYARS